MANLRRIRLHSDGDSDLINLQRDILSAYYLDTNQGTVTTKSLGIVGCNGSVGFMIGATVPGFSGLTVGGKISDYKAFGLVRALAKAYKERLSLRKIDTYKCVLRMFGKVGTEPEKFEKLKVMVRDTILKYISVCTIIFQPISDVLVTYGRVCYLSTLPSRYFFPETRTFLKDKKEELSNVHNMHNQKKPGIVLSI